MNEQDFLRRLQKKYPYAYSLIPSHMWTWIYNNVIASKDDLPKYRWVKINDRLPERTGDYMVKWANNADSSSSHWIDTPATKKRWQDNVREWMEID